METDISDLSKKRKGGWTQRTRSGPCHVDGCDRPIQARKLCSKHYMRDFQRKKSAELRKNDVCRRCQKAEPRPQAKHCDACLKHVRTRQQVIHAERRARGECPYDGTPATAGACCTNCWFKEAANRGLRNRRHATAIKTLFEDQKGRCAYTGDVLIPGDNASLDHIDPISLGGSNDPNNVQWVTKVVNRMKTNMNHDEFVGMCLRISARQSEIF